MYKLWKKAAIFDSFKAAYHETESLYAEAEELFHRLDLNKDGKICRAEFIHGFPDLDANNADDLIAEVRTCRTHACT